MSYSVLGIGSPIVDYILEVDEDFLKMVGGAKGGMELVDLKRFHEILKQAPAKPIIIPGGSATNVIRGLANLDHQCAITGKISNDDPGRLILNTVTKLGITPLYVSSTTPTGIALCLVTPDRERTLRTYMGAFMEMQGSNLKPEWFRDVKLVHIEGYSLLNDGLTLRAMQLAKEAGAKVSFDLASFEIATRFKEQIVHDVVRYVDILFANQLEAKILTGIDDPERGINLLKDMCDTVVISMGKKGGWAANHNKVISYRAVQADAIDSTGAGDLFACGFLHGVLNEFPLEKCAEFGAETAAAVVEVYGADVPVDKWLILNRLMSEK